MLEAEDLRPVITASLSHMLDLNQIHVMYARELVLSTYPASQPDPLHCTSTVPPWFSFAVQIFRPRLVLSSEQCTPRLTRAAMALANPGLLLGDRIMKSELNWDMHNYSSECLRVSFLRN